MSELAGKEAQPLLIERRLLLELIAEAEERGHRWCFSAAIVPAIVPAGWRVVLVPAAVHVEGQVRCRVYTEPVKKDKGGGLKRVGTLDVDAARLETMRVGASDG